jgi:hypothetical protein
MEASLPPTVGSIDALSLPWANPGVVYTASEIATIYRDGFGLFFIPIFRFIAVYREMHL